MPASKLPPSLPAVVEELEQRLHVRFVTGRRYASRAIRDRIFVGARLLFRGDAWAGTRRSRTAARACPSAGSGLILIRTADLNRADARVIHVDLVVGDAPCPRCSGCGRPSGSHSSLTNDTPTTCGPAATGTRTSRPASPPICMYFSHRDRRRSPARRRRRSWPRPAGPAPRRRR